MDKKTKDHLCEWLRRRFAYNDFNMFVAKEKLIKLVDEYPELLETKSWPEMLHMTDFMYTFDTQVSCESLEIMNEVLASYEFSLNIETNSGLKWQVRSVRFGKEGLEFNTIFQPQEVWQKAELYGGKFFICDAEKG